MSISACALAEGGLATLQTTSNGTATKTPPKRQTVSRADVVQAPEPR